MHTKGEWKVSKITTKQGLKLAGGYEYGLWAHTETPSSFRAESIAFIKHVDDASLIQAAPTMYEAIRKFIEAAESAHKPIFIGMNITLGELRNALNKADGK